MLKVFNWQLSGNTSCCNFSESDFQENESSNLKQAKETCRSVLDSLSKDNLDNLIFAHLNVNSIRNKFNYLSEQIRDNVDILLVLETKIDVSFLQGQFVLDGFNAPYRLDRNCLGGGLMLLVREDIPSNLTIEEKPIESFYVALNLRNSKWLVNCSYNPHKNSIRNHLHKISESLDLLSSDYEKMIFLGDFNVTDDEHHMKSFCENYGLKNLVRQPTCYKNQVIQYV